MKLLVIILACLASLDGEAMVCRQILSNVSNEVIARPKYHQNKWTTDAIVKVIKAFKKEGLPLYGAAVKRGGEIYSKIMERELGYRASLKRLVESKPIEGWTWNKALEQAGLNPKEERAHKASWTTNEIVKVVKAFHKAGLSLSRSAVRDGGAEYQKVVKSILGATVSLERMVDVKPIDNWSWNKALTEAGLDPAAHWVKKHSWGEDEIVKVIESFSEAGLSVNVKAVREGGKAYERIILEVTGHASGTQGIINAKPSKGWTWDVALAKSGLDPVIERRRSLNWKWTEAEVIKVVKRLHALDYALNYDAVQKGGESYRLVINEILNVNVSVHSLLKAAPEEGWSWNLSLVRAGFNPNEIRLKGVAPFHLLTKIMQEEVSANYEAMFPHRTTAIQSSRIEGDVEVVVVDERSGEALYHEREVSRAVQEKAESLTDREREILNGLLSYFEINKDLDLERMSGFLDEEGMSSSIIELLDIIQKIKKDSKLRSLIFTN